MSVADYNTDPDSNTSISGINIAEGCPPSGINNAIRQMMADIKTADDANVKLSGNQTLAGTKTFSAGLVIATSAALKRSVNNSYLNIYGGTAYGNGAYISLHGKDDADAGFFVIRASDGASNRDLIGKPDGTLTWAGKGVATDDVVVHLTGNETIAGTKTFLSGPVIATSASLKRDVDNGYLNVYGGSGYGKGAYISLHGKDDADAGNFVVRASNGTANKDMIGKPDGTLTWSGQPIQTSSDERLKTALADVPDAVLDAWGGVGWGQFRYLDAVEAKGADKARLHLGLIAQRVKAVFEAHGLDACAYGILCHEERPATDEEPAVDLWMVRYTEAAAMEAAYQRRRADRAEARMAELERRLGALEAAFVAVGA